jgi:fermentation-respiration switch protein FrsA (DUF1100 family)
MKILLLTVCLTMILSCCDRIYSLDDFLFEPEKINEYLCPLDMDPEWNVRFVIPDSLYEEVTMTSMGNTIYGFFVRGNPDSVENNDVTILYCHGNTENINRYWGRVEILWEMGYNVFIFDYQGYGRSKGDPSGEALYSDGRSALDYIRTRPEVVVTKLVYYGWSLGSYVATFLSADVDPGAAVVLEAPPASVSRLLQDGVLFELPGSYVAEADFDNEKRIAHIGCPLLMMHGRDDDYVVFERHVPYIWDNAVAPKESLWVDGATHDDIPAVLGNEYNQKVIGFIGTYVD